MKVKKRRQLVLYIAICLLTVGALVFWDQAYNVKSLFTPFKDAFSFVSGVTKTEMIASQGFVTRSGSQLMLYNQPFRFAGANMHWLGLDDSTDYPSQFRINDGFDAAQEMGATVIRAHSLGISTGCNNCIEPSLGLFNDTALAHNDYVIKIARNHGMRLIIPLTDNWHYATGGKHTFTDWRNISDENQFYVNTQVIKDFETYVRTLLNHVNKYTGIPYKDDPTILAWETGNELDAPTQWTQTISTYIKSVDSNHLVVDGKTGIDPNAGSLTHVDIVSNHYYPKNIAKLTNDANAARKADKAFIVGEFDWNDTNGGDTLSNFLSTIESNSSIAGDIFWELWSHNDLYGYLNGDKQYTLHYPGDSVDMRRSVQQLRKHAYKMRNIPVPMDSIPGVPLIEVVIRDDLYDVLVWRGTAIAANYSIERSSSSVYGPWKVICNKCATDINVPWIDKTTPTGPVWYRVIEYNASGVASKPSIPYQAGSSGITIDNLNDWSKTYEHSSNLTFDTTNSQNMNDDPSRAERIQNTHEYIIWRQAAMTSFQAITYFWPYELISHFSIYTSLDGRNWTSSNPAITRLNGDWIEYIYTLNGLSNVNYVKLEWNNVRENNWSPQLGEVTITY